MTDLASGVLPSTIFKMEEAKPGVGAVTWWTFDLVRAALVEAMTLWMRSPGPGRSPWASDGPWQMMLREVSAGDYDARGGLDTSGEGGLRPLPLDRDEVGRRDRISEWVQLIGQAEIERLRAEGASVERIERAERQAEFDRRLTWKCLEYYARGYRQLPWHRIKRRMGIENGIGGLKKRLSRAFCAIATALNAAENRGSKVSRGQM